MQQTDARIVRLEAGPLRFNAHLNSDGKLVEVGLPAKIPAGLEAAHLHSAIKQLGEFPLELPETGVFTKKVWQALGKIPWGKAKTYQEIATSLGSPKSYRAVGNACGSNRLLLIIPCHRVLASTGLGGFRLGLAWKAKLLELETESLAALK